jgi:hypothetical protein
MQDAKYAGKYGVEQQLKLLSKWLSESGFGEAALLVSAAAMSVQDMTGHKGMSALGPDATTIPEQLAKPLRAMAATPAAADLQDKRRARSA